MKIYDEVSILITILLIYIMVSLETHTINADGEVLRAVLGWPGFIVGYRSYETLGHRGNCIEFCVAFLRWFERQDQENGRTT